MGIWSYSGTAGSNTSISGISWAEGMAPSNLNNGVRQIAADVKNYATDTGGKLVAGGTANALTLTTASTISANEDGVEVSFVASASNTGTTTLNVDGKGAKAVRKVTNVSTNDTGLAADDIRINGHYTARYDASADSAAGAWILLNPATPSNQFPAGSPVIGQQFRTSSFTLADDTAQALATTGGGVIVAITTQSTTAPAPRGIFACRPNIPNIANVAMVSVVNVTFTTGALAGATGADGDITLSAHTDNNIYIENRSGGSKTFTVSILG
jgi:hypothetical protein